jgi:Ser/Thr protein kinase RdoA (MazF antagonist)
MTPAAAGPATLEIARAAISRYPVAPDSPAELVRYGENTTYRVRAGARSLALRLLRPGYQSRAAVESEIAWMSALRDHGIETPAAVAGRDGSAVQELSVGDDPPQLAIAFEWVEGVPLPEVEGPEPWRRLGEIMARVHVHGRAWLPPRGFTRPAWDLDAIVGDCPRWGSPVPRGVWSESERTLIIAARDAVRARLKIFGTASGRFGLIHADLGFENVLVARDGTTVVIDFDDCGASWYLYELASALYPHEGSPSFAERRDMLIDGYRQITALPENELEELPTFLMGRRLATLGWTFSRADTPHAERQRERRLATTPGAATRFLEWHADRPPCSV